MRPQLALQSKAQKTSPSPLALSFPTSWMGNSANPKGIQQQSPGLRGTSYPGSFASGPANPNGVASIGGERGHNPVGVEKRFARFPRVARRLATLGWRTQSLWDWPRQHSGLLGNDKPPAEGGEGWGEEGHSSWGWPVRQQLHVPLPARSSRGWRCRLSCRLLSHQIKSL